MKLSLQTLRALLIGTVTALAISPLSAMSETIVVPVGEQGKDKSTIERPAAGMKKEQVEARFGKPLETKDAIGEPPISSWRYSEFVVYFEYDHVVHTVLRHTPVASNGATTAVSTTTASTTSAE